ncbi:RsmB/NOP family class I SAM-dependent RNA methyltransferase [Alphaproteobacteria bacterium KMM 3653]|uniref:RsmB/NOP family class I SAM-dependent RNA methyltransferase n=1 Tax=Harenicola maris TaxID=2841044 RepID=A0AAP2CLV6_9RHOB|nr:RsmB/NOP family class I SAM-dependent RNA methyltransferase [Harenicola maris]
MTPAARYAAAAEVLDAVLDGAAAEQSLTAWARRSRFAGSGDRAAVRDHVYDALRARASLAVLGGALSGRGLLLGLMRRSGGDAAALFGADRFSLEALSAEEAAHLAAPEPELPADVPEWLLPQLQADLGGEFDRYNNLLRGRAEVTLRVNAARVSVAEAAAALAAEEIATEPHPEVETALIVTGNPRRVQNSAPYREGLVELQDAGSQVVVKAVPFPGGGRVLDYCAGGGGKVLALAARGEATFFAHDGLPRRMVDLPARAARAGVDVTCIEVPSGTYDLVLADVPCSGSGAWRRQPDAKWRMTAEGLADLTQLQREIIAQCQAITARGGCFCYVTCSVLRAENEDQIAATLGQSGDWEEVETRRFPVGPLQDGFFLSVFRRIV